MVAVATCPGAKRKKDKGGRCFCHTSHAQELIEAECVPGEEDKHATIVSDNHKGINLKNQKSEVLNRFSHETMLTQHPLASGTISCSLHLPLTETNIISKIVTLVRVRLAVRENRIEVDT